MRHALLNLYIRVWDSGSPLLLDRSSVGSIPTSLTNITESSNGRTVAFEAINFGSNPSTVANIPL